MALKADYELIQLPYTTTGNAKFYEPLISDETMLVTLPPQSVSKLFVHLTHTDNLMVLRGQAVHVLLIGGDYHYIGMSEAEQKVLKIPPKIVHGAINLTNEPCTMVNAVVRHRPAIEADYRPIEWRFPYDEKKVRACQSLLSVHGALNCSLI